MLGFAASLVGEILTGKGAAGQLGLETGVTNLSEIDGLIALLAVFNLIAAVFPASGKFVPEEDFSDRSAGSLQNPNVSLANPKEFFGVKKFGFTKENELFVGRVAQLGFAFSLIGEALTGNGPLAQFGFETGIPINETEPLLIAFIFFTFFAAINEGTGKFIKDE